MAAMNCQPNAARLAAKRKRAVTIQPDHKDVVTELGLLAKKRSTRFLWDATDYTKSRGSTGDQEHLERVCMVLLVLVKHARNGYPCHKGLRAILIALDIQYNMFDLADVSKRFSTANHAADTWRCMLRHCIELKRSGRTITHEGLSSVIDALVDDHDDTGPQIQAQQPDVELNQDGFHAIDDPPPEADVVRPSVSLSLKILRPSLCLRLRPKI